MILAAALVRDSVAHVERFVVQNLGGGVDHLLVFLDGPQPEVEAFLATRDEVTTVVADPEWWGPERVDTLNGRQRVAANLAREACAGLDFVDWLFFVDGDEVALLDESVLATVPADVPAVRLRPLESVSHPAAEGLFKHLLDRRDLRRLHRRGLLEKANNAHYFHGHVSGKVGVRPSAPLWLGVHSAHHRDGEKVTAFEHPALRHLHYESPDLDEFVRKWTELAASGPPPGMRHARAEVLQAFIDLADEPDAAVRRAAYERLFSTFAAEDVEGLRRAGVLEVVDPASLTHVPTPLTGPERAALDEALAAACRRPKTSFLPPRWAHDESPEPG